MARKQNYSYERFQRENAKAAKRLAKTAEKAARENKTADAVVDRAAGEAPPVQAP